MIKVFTDLFFFSLQIQKREYYHYAQVDFDFGQVHVVRWLSYGQVGEKISVEPCVIIACTGNIETALGSRCIPSL